MHPVDNIARRTQSLPEIKIKKPSPPIRGNSLPTIIKHNQPEAKAPITVTNYQSYQNPPETIKPNALQQFIIKIVKKIEKFFERTLLSLFPTKDRIEEHQKKFSYKKELLANRKEVLINKINDLGIEEKNKSNDFNRLEQLKLISNKKNIEFARLKKDWYECVKVNDEMTGKGYRRVRKRTEKNLKEKYNKLHQNELEMQKLEKLLAAYDPQAEQKIDDSFKELEKVQKKIASVEDELQKYETPLEKVTKFNAKFASMNDRFKAVKRNITSKQIEIYKREKSRLVNELIDLKTVSKDTEDRELQSQISSAENKMIRFILKLSRAEFTFKLHELCNLKSEIKKHKEEYSNLIESGLLQSSELSEDQQNSAIAQGLHVNVEEVTSLDERDESIRKLEYQIAFINFKLYNDFDSDLTNNIILVSGLE